MSKTPTRVNCSTPKLVQKLGELGKRRKAAIQERQARTTLGPSIMRVFVKGTSDDVRPILEALPLDAVRRCRNESHYRRWFERQLERLAFKITSRNRTNDRIHPGAKWGHAAKILNAFMQGIVRHSRYFGDKEAKRIEPWLYVPLDAWVMKELRACGIKTPLRIKQIDSAATFYELQGALGEAANEAGVSRILFDDVWAGDRN